MIICAGNQIGKMYGGQWIFDKLTFEIQDGDRIGIVGRNGSGKTTLLRLISGNEDLDQGEIYIQKGATIGYLAQIPTFPESTRVLDVLEMPFAELRSMEKRLQELELEMANRSLASDRDMKPLLDEYGVLQAEFERRGGYEIQARIAEVCQGLGIDQEMLNKHFHTLSGGEQTKVGLANILLMEPDLLLLDEPTNHLDLYALEWLEEFLKNFKGAVVVISHDRYFLDRVVNKIFDLEDGELTAYSGNYSAFVVEKEARLLAEFHAYQEQQKKIKKMKEAIKQLREWANRANPPNANLHRRANSMQKALDRMEKLKRPILERKKIDVLFGAEERSGKDVITLKEVSKSFGGRTLFKGISALIRYQDRAAIVGENGAGKSTLLKIILNEIEPDSGTVKLGSGVKVGYLSQMGLEGYDEATVIEAFRDQIPVPEGEARNLLARFLFYGSHVFRKVRDLSGGERMRLRLAQLMHQEVNLLILDEPTNHLDIDSREVLEEALEEFAGTILAVSHDRYFLNKLFTNIYWLEDQSLTLYEGNFEEASIQRKKRKTSQIQISEVAKTHMTNKRTDSHVPEKIKKSKQKSSSDLEKEIMELEHAIDQLEKWIHHPDHQHDLAELMKKVKEKDELEVKRDRLYMEWEEKP